MKTNGVWLCVCVCTCSTHRHTKRATWKVWRKGKRNGFSVPINNVCTSGVCVCVCIPLTRQSMGKWTVLVFGVSGFGVVFFYSTSHFLPLSINTKRNHVRYRAAPFNRFFNNPARAARASPRRCWCMHVRSFCVCMCVSMVRYASGAFACKRHQKPHHSFQINR